MTQAATFQLPEHLAARHASQRSETIAQIICIAVALVALLGAAALVPRINEIRTERQLVIDPGNIQGLPPDIALLGKMGTFRALAIDWAFIRADRMKQEGKMYEAYDLHQTICKLAPRFPAVWVHSSWNMAYNISVTQFSPEARWQWVSNGIKVIRDQGLEYNPKSVTLYKELAWTYWHKIGDILDDEHLSYKKVLATDMERILGPPPIVLSDQDYFDWFKKIVDAPRDLATLIETDAEIARTVSALKELKLTPDMKLLEFIARHMRPELRSKDLVTKPSPDDTLFDRQLRFFKDKDKAPARERLVAAVRSHVLRTDEKFDLDWMWELMTTMYGPIDWRNGAAHALYWASYGDKIARGHINLNRSDQLNNARFVFFALQNLIARGRVVLDPNFDDAFLSYVDLLPDTRIIPYAHETYMRLGKEHFGDDSRFVEGTPGPNYMAGFVTAMSNWIQLLYLEGGSANEELAQEYYTWLREFNPHPDGSPQEMYLLTLEEFVMYDILAQMGTYRAATAVLRKFVDRAIGYFASGNDTAGATSLVRARKLYEYWMLDTRIDTNDRRKLQRFAVIVRDQVQDFFKRQNVGAIWKARLWKTLPKQQRQWLYDDLAPYFAELCAAQDPPWGPSIAFPEPPDMEVYRKNPDIELRGESRRDDVELGAEHK